LREKPNPICYVATCAAFESKKASKRLRIDRKIQREADLNSKYAFYTNLAHNPERGKFKVVANMILSKARSSISAHGERRRLQSSSQSKRSSVPELQDFLDARDYEGAIALLQFKRQVPNPKMPE